MYDLLIRNARIVDFKKNDLIEGAVGIKDGLIAAIGDCSESAVQEIDAKGNIVAPGFIDIHMHEEILDFSKGADAYDISESMLAMGVTTCVAGNCGNNRQSFVSFKNFVNTTGAPVNYLSYIGHNYLRELAGNTDRYRKSTPSEIAIMQDEVLKSLEMGAVGISFGLEYCPGIDKDEVLALCEVVLNRKMLLAAHYRKDAKFALDAIDELIDISRQSGFPMQISHIGSCAAFGQMTEAFERIEKSRSEGLDTWADCYPYDAFSTYIGSAVFDEGCFDLWNKSYDSILLTEKPYKGVRCTKELFHKVRKEYPKMLVVAFVMNEPEVVEALQNQYCMVASDGLLRDGQGHPRAAGSFPRVLGKFVREDKQMDLLDALKKMTLMPAGRLNLTQKGTIEVGKDADLVIFNPETIHDNASYEDPKAKPSGIDYVLIHGKIALEGQTIINGTLGKFIPSQL